MLSQRKRANVQTHIWRFVTEPYEHSIVWITFVRISRYVEITYSFDSVRRHCTYGRSDVSQIFSDVLRARVHVFNDAARSDGSGFVSDKLPPFCVGKSEYNESEVVKITEIF